MTFFLDPVEEAPDVPGSVPPRDDVPNWFTTIGAAIKTASLENDANFVVRRTRVSVKDDLATSVIDRIGMDRIRPILEERNRKAREAGLTAQVKDIPDNVQDAVAQFGPNFTDEVLKLAREAAADDPDAWKDVDLSDDAIEALVNERLRTEYEDAKEILAMSPHAGLGTGLLGGFVGTTLDVKNLPFLLLGGGTGSFVRIMGREALINASAEAAFLPAQFDMAERLDIPDPNVAEHLAMAAGAGAAFGASAEALFRGFRYLAGRNEVPAPSRLAPAPENVAAIDRAEDALATSPDPFEEVRKIADEGPLVLKNPINPEREPLVPERQAEPAPPSSEAALVEAEDAIVQDFPVMRFKYPLARQIQLLGGVKYREKNAAGEWKLTHAAQELAVMGITPKTHPFIWRRDGMGDLDNIDPDSIGPGITEVIPRADDSLYLDRQALIDALGRELSTGQKTPLSGEIADRMSGVSRMQSTDPLSSARDDFLAGVRSVEEDILFIDLNHYLFDEMEYVAMRRIEDDFNSWLATRQYADVLTDAERAEIVQELQRHGGDAEILVETVLSREIDYASKPPQEAPDYDWIPFDENEPPQEATVGSGAEIGEGQVPNAEPEGRGATRLGRDSGTVSEPTAAGDQTLIPGVAPITQRDRLQLAQDSPLRGGDTPAGGLFDTGARAQMDIFDDPATATEIHGQIEADMRTALETDGDFDVNFETDDGRTLKKASDVLDYLDEGDRFSARIDLCGKGPT